MKKFLALFLSLVMLVGLVPFSVSADEVEQQRCDNLINKAASVFPEYADKLLEKGNQPLTYSNDEHSVLLVKETRSVSDKERITYAEYSNGVILLTEEEFLADTTVVDETTGATYRKVTMDIEASCVIPYYYDGYFYLDGFSCIIRDGMDSEDNMDSITSRGNPREGSNCSGYSEGIFIENETFEGHATVHWNLGFYNGPYDEDVLTSYLSISVGSDEIHVDHLGWN